MKRLWYVILLLIFPLKAVEYKETLEKSLLSHRFTGFVRNDVFADTRQSYAFHANPLLIVPYEPQYDPLGADINAVNRFGITPLRSYLRLDVWGAEFSSVQAHACMQWDFVGPQDIQEGLVRCWYLYGEIYSESNQFLIGEFRHPFRPLKAFPSALTYNPAAIEQAPQIRWRHQFANGIATHLTAFSELTFASFGVVDDGIIAANTKFIRNSMKPGIAGRLEYTTPIFVAGIGLLGFSVVPRICTALCYPTQNSLPCCWATAYSAVTTPDVEIKGQLLWGQNVASINPVGGYVATSCSNENGACSYRALQDLLVWLDLSWQRHSYIHPGLYVEYTPVVGHGPTAIDPVTQQVQVYGANSRLQSVLRCCPRLMFDICPAFKVGIEYSYVRANYGSLRSNGRYVNTAPIAMGRLLMVTWCFLL